jgi:acetyl-CoA carboxylase carboxyl transferase subunit alpha
MNILEKEAKLKDLLLKIEEMDDCEAKAKMEEEVGRYKASMMKDLSAWDQVLLARHSDRPKTSDFVELLTDDYLELCGDRGYRDDQSIKGYLAKIAGMNVTIIGQQKGKKVEEQMKYNFGMPHPEGYRKALRLMKQAEKFHRPIITLIDTPGAYPGIEAEERGQGEAIARNLYEMSDLSVPILSIVIGEGGSGGALGIGVANEVYMLEHAVYSILSPEGYASILWKDASKAKEAASVMKLTSKDLLELGIIEGIIKEPLGGAHFHPKETVALTKTLIVERLKELMQVPVGDLIQARRAKYREIGFFQRFNYDNLGGREREVFKN